jgi:CofH/MqnC C-terminal region
MMPSSFSVSGISRAEAYRLIRASGFIAAEAPMYKKSLVPGIAASVPDEDVLRMYALSRLMLDPWIPDIHASWVKQGPWLAQRCLHAGANDFGGTLINESISTSAGAPHGQFLHPAEMRRWIRDAGGTPVQRSTTYRTLRSFEQEPVEAEPCRSPDRFGSYGQLIAPRSLGPATGEGVFDD